MKTRKNNLLKTKINFLFIKNVKRFFTLFSLLLFFSFPSHSQDFDISKGKSLFNANCAACHKLNKNLVGPKLAGVTDKYEKEWLYTWIKNSSGMIKSGDERAVAVWEEWNKLAMNAFPQLSNEDIDNILAYTDYKPEPVVATAAGDAAVAQVQTQGLISQDIILVAMIIVLMVLITMLYLVNRTLREIAIRSGWDDKYVVIKKKQKKPSKPIWLLFIRNQFLVFCSVVFFLLSSAYFAYGWLMQVGIDQGYMPIQPIHYSHKIHSGANQIDCQYCHSSARVSKHSGIPSLNVCMNCHENIAEYDGEEDLEKGYTKDFYTNEIKKLYKAVGWDENKRIYTGDVEPVKWVRIHNLPDFVYFNHAQHVNVAGVECQTCHGPVEEMEIAYQHSSLTMGWCINCHRETNVNVKDNEYYTKIHEELSKKYGVEKLTIAQMGGLECGKCHY